MKNLLILLFIVTSYSLYAVETGAETPVDTLKLLSDTPIKSPIGAVLRSAVLPGLGQAYNEAYPKALFVAALNGGMIWRSVHFHNKFNNEALPDGVRKNARNRRNASNWLLGMSYFLTLVDAYVDAYLFQFDTAISISATDVPLSPDAVGLQLRIKF